jgi:hypothetical protein
MLEHSRKLIGNISNSEHDPPGNFLTALFSRGLSASIAETMHLSLPFGPRTMNEEIICSPMKHRVRIESCGYRFCVRTSEKPNALPIGMMVC